MMDHIYLMIRSWFAEQMNEEIEEVTRDCHEAIEELKRQHKANLDEVYQQGYQQAEDDYKHRIDKLVADKYSERNWLVNPNNIIYWSENSGVTFLGYDQITKEEAKSLKEEIAYLKKCRIWDIFNETIKKKAIDKAVMHSTNFEQVLSGKLMIHNLQILRDIVERIEKIKL